MTNERTFTKQELMNQAAVEAKRLMWGYVDSTTLLIAAMRLSDDALMATAMAEAASAYPMDRSEVHKFLRTPDAFDTITWLPDSIPVNVDDVVKSVQQHGNRIAKELLTFLAK